jgi:hypothetical protein
LGFNFSVSAQNQHTPFRHVSLATTPDLVLLTPSP